MSKATTQAAVSVKHVSEMGYYQGEKKLPGVKFIYAGKELGVTSLGMNAIEIAPNDTHYFEHDHQASGEEEIYILVRGSATLHAEDEDWAIEPGTLARVGPSAKRKFLAGPQGATLVAISNVPD